jgi:hypothetical protein
MPRQYFKDVDEPIGYKSSSGTVSRSQDFTFTAVGDPIKETSSDVPRAAGDEKEQFHPYATLGGTFIDTNYEPNFDNRTDEDIPNSTRASGLSQHALRKAREKTYDHPDITADDKSHMEIRRDLNARHMDEMGISHSGSPEHNEYVKKVKSGHYDKLEKDAVKRASTHPYFQQDTLFDTTPSTMHVHTMFSDPSMTTSAITLGAIAKQHFGASKVAASHDLSPFSSKLVKNAEKRGLVQPSDGNPKANVTNASTLSPLEMPSTLLDAIQSARVPDSEVASARSSLRESLRGNKVVRNNTPVTPKGLSNQFLPGMEGFI